MPKGIVTELMHISQYFDNMASFYATTLIQTPQTNEPPYIKIREFLYRFKTASNHTYFILVEEYINQLFGIKFYAKNHRYSLNKYKLLTRNNNPQEVRSIFLTCLHIGSELSKKYPNHSFAFIGCPKYNSNETYENNQRFRLYRRMVTTFISEDKFVSYQDKKYSTFLLINQSALLQDPQLLITYRKMYLEHIISLLD